VLAPSPSIHFWEPGGNSIEDNIVTHSGVADLALSALSAGNNCFSNNTVAHTAPPFLQLTHACGSLFARAGGGDPGVALTIISHYNHGLSKRFKPADWKKAPMPAIQPGMPDPTSAPQGIFTDREGTPLMMTIAPTSIAPTLTLGSLGLAGPFFEVLLGFYTYYLPLALYSAWLSVATWDIVRRSKMNGRARVGWLAIVYLIPVLGPLAYYLAGRSEISWTTRLALVIGAPLIYLLIAAALLFTVS